MSGPLGGDISQRVSAGVGGGVLCVAIRAGPGRGAAGWGGGAGGRAQEITSVSAI